MIRMMPELFSRRARIIWAAIALTMLISGAGLPAAAMAPYDGKLTFDVIRGGKSIGKHEITFREVGDETHVDIDIELTVKIGFLTVFKYRHQNSEVWRGGTLVSVATDTDDNGDAYEVRARREGDGLFVRTLQEEHVLPGTAIPTSYWNPAILMNPQWLDTQRGIMLDIAVEPAGLEAVSLADGRTIEAERFEVRGDLNITVWYTPQGEWVKLAFPARGADIEYVLTQGYTGTRLTQAQ
ncbi:MAG: DUF6134 family protein [Alphaproteobacteria bacterium]